MLTRGRPTDAGRARGRGRGGRRRRAGDGFTLLELLVALVILQVGILSLVAVIPLTQVQVVKAEHEAAATQLVREQLESLGRRAYADSLLAAGGPYSDPQNPIDGRFNRTWTVAADQPIPDTKTVVVAVSWSHAGSERRVEARTVVARN